MEENSKNSFVFDTSALISLGSVNLMGKTSEIANIITCQSVIKELNDFCKFEDYYGMTGKEVLKYKDKFIILQSSITDEIKFVEETDSELYNLAKEKSLPLITDDIKLSRHLEGKIKVYFSTYFLSALVNSGNISKKKSLELLEKLSKERNWQNNIIYLISRKELGNL